MVLNNSTLVKRSQLAGLFLRPLGYGYYGVEQTEEGFTFFGQDGRRLAFSELAGLPKNTKRLGFQSVSFTLKDSSELTLVGLNRNDRLKLISTAQSALNSYCAAIINESGDELHALARVISRLKDPRRYPSACLLEPFLNRAQDLCAKLPESFSSDAINEHANRCLDEIRRFVSAPHAARDEAIQRFIQTELKEMSGFFDKIESNPLTPEQRLAVATDEDASLILAGAGSGKTSVIVAKAAYLIERGIRAPNEILLMAFGKDAAAEMAARIKERSGEDVDAITFHALGYRIINQVEGSAPALAAHASDDAQFRALLRDILINDIGRIDGLNSLLLQWFSEFYRPFKSEWDFQTKSEYYQYVESHDLRTLGGDRVKSFEELLIANWLYLNGIEYEYEPTYEHTLPENERRAYTPDFRLTESGVYIEHFGVRKHVGANGETHLVTAPQVDRGSYLEGIAWKRKVHQDNGTILIETFSYEQVEGRLTEALAEKIAPFAACKPIPQNQVFAALTELGQIDAFTQTLATFLRHFKGSGITIEQCQKRSANCSDGSRSNAFLKIFEPVIAAYQKRLDGRIDFEDMIVRAAEHVETGRFKSPYRHILVDEFQDISESRARLLKALKAQHDDARLFAVGDDWQSIYRFTGSDIHLMRDFGHEFGGTFADKQDVHCTVDLGRTFRSVDRIALPARRFVLQNPAQIDKKVVTASRSDEPAIKVRYYERRQHDAALKETLDELELANSKKTSVLLLGRYHFLKPKSFRTLSQTYSNITLQFMTVHASKGLEADHVIILRAESDIMGFPSEIVDDPLLDLVLPEPENFEHAEERRLFYVALTRARHSVTILADREKPSVFVREWSENPEYEIVQLGTTGIAENRCGRCGGRMLSKTSKKGRVLYSCEHGRLCGAKQHPCSACGQDLPKKDPSNSQQFSCSCGAMFPACPECDEGWLIERTSKFGKFLSCIRYPECTGKRQLPKAKKAYRN